MDLEIILLNEVSQAGKDNYHTPSLTCGIGKTDTNRLSTRRLTVNRRSHRAGPAVGGRLGAEKDAVVSDAVNPSAVHGTL